MTTTPTSRSAASAAGAATAGPDGIARLHPFDGLFLRAEHLDRLQSYTQELTRALGQAGGTGVVHGYGLTLSQPEKKLSVGGGLAFLPNGQPLRMFTAITVTLETFTEANGAWVIELAARDEPFGDDTVFGALCEDPCDGADATTKPYVAEGVEVRLHPFATGEERSKTPNERRSRVAKAWFAAERDAAGGLVVGASDREGNFSQAAWSEPTELPGSEVPGGFAEPKTVPIGVLLRIEDRWVLDTWIARRDRIDTPPRRAWEGRLGMRPWDVFVAQVLQFQVHLADELPRAAATVEGVATRLLAIKELDEALEILGRRRTGGVTKLLSSASDRLKGKILRAGTGHDMLFDLGFVELPPAGFLPVLEGNDLVENKVRRLLGDRVDLRFCACRPDAVAHAVTEAQHLDRIPLTGAGSKPKVDVLVPTDSGSWGAAGYGWVAFHRRRDRDCRVEQTEDPKDLVDIYVHNVPDPDQLRGDLIAGRRPGTLPTPRTVPYPVDSWALPPALEQDAVDQATTAAEGIVAVGLTKLDRRARLIWVRAALLVHKFITQESLPPTAAETVAAVDRNLPGNEEIHVIVPSSVVNQ